MAHNFRWFLMALSVMLAIGGGETGAARAASFARLYSFCSDYKNSTCLDGEASASRLLQVGEGFYGATSAGGTKGHGTLFRMTTSGTITTIYAFCQENFCSDGDGPGVYLAYSPHKALYGITHGGGTSNGGTIFEVLSPGKISVVYRFCVKANCADGIYPVSVVFDANGILFGTTSGGGSQGSGIAFTLDSGGALHVLHNFCSAASCADGVTPGALILGKDGNFYGTTSAGGKHQAGSVFRMTPAGAVTTLYSFCAAKACADGEQPTSILAQGTDGNFYGTTVRGGANNFGIVFRVSPAGAFTALHAFCNNAFCYDGSTPVDGVSAGRDGSVYGTTSSGGRFYHGTVFRVTADGVFSIVHNFCSLLGCFDGSGPFTSPIQGTDGSFYGATPGGGITNNTGVVYRLTP